MTVNQQRNAITKKQLQKTSADKLSNWKGEGGKKKLIYYL